MKTRIIQKEIIINQKGAIIQTEMNLPKDAKQIVGVIILSDASSGLFPAKDANSADDPSSLTPINQSDSSGNGHSFSTVKDWFFAIQAGEGYEKFDRIERTVFHIKNPDDLKEGKAKWTNFSSWHNHSQGKILFPAPKLEDLAHTSESEEKYHNPNPNPNPNT